MTKHLLDLLFIGCPLRRTDFAHPFLARGRFESFFGNVARTGTDGSSRCRLGGGDGSGNEERRENTPSLLSASFSSFPTVHDFLSDWPRDSAFVSFYILPLARPRARSRPRSRPRPRRGGVEGGLGLEVQVEVWCTEGRPPPSW